MVLGVVAGVADAGVEQGELEKLGADQDGGLGGVFLVHAIDHARGLDPVEALDE
ncbi:hypothetical protein D3C86_1971750 [compost metagenome]